MATMTKFGFNAQFEIEPPPIELELELEPDTALSAAPQVPLLTENDLTAAREAGFEAGREAGREAGLSDATAAAEGRLADALSEIAGQIGALGPGYQETLAACRVDAVGIAGAIVRKTVAAAEYRVALAGVEQMIASFLPQLLDEPRIVVRVSDALLDGLQERIQPLAENSGFKGGIVLLAEPGLASPDCRIEWADGGAEKESGALWREIDVAMENYLAAAKGNNGAATDPVPQAPNIDTSEMKSEEKTDG